MTSAASQELKVDFILALLHDRGGKIKYAELVNMFETVLFQAAPDARDRNRKQFQDILSKVGFITEEERTKYVVLKPASDGAFGVEEETLSAFVDDSKRSVDTDFPDEAPANLLEWWVLDPSTRAGTEEALLEDEKDDRSSCIPFVVITQADEKETKSEMNKRDPWQDLNGDVESLKSESGSVGSEAAASVSIKGDTDQEGTDDDLQSITTSSVNSLFQRLQLDPLEHDWIRYAAMGNTAALTHLLLQDPTLASKKDFNSGTALHWAAKHGKEEMAEMIAKTDIDVNVKSGGYTALHIAALHGHRHIIVLLINTYNAKPNIRDYYGKMPLQYWKGSEDLFKPASLQPCGKLTSEDRPARKHNNFPALLRNTQSRSQSRTGTEILPYAEMALQSAEKALLQKRRSPSCTRI
ncbi:ankyrin repeat domain-containing protein SOWAHC-like isoform X2 [Callorhinchus milii]|uniref:ankyrin repeat domain-containing protein SOWAHC-like isoform X2 n=1 Tax=Callorhinchus milii TaxID=7868 RepID=UPI0004572780|nr:ankyrin repeat domain-containing protein SOWAHC-like isoform X2 [Callorhinchus milii]|eukprot:gi/632944745/ref/XP_007887671.1/ PREDICTED: ankyrin repeat domain-containing protein SOWAHC-like isoform X2 [Callorhinchus milii]